VIGHLQLKYVPGNQKKRKDLAELSLKEKGCGMYKRISTNAKFKM
jgi:hypothetical protein